MVVSFSWERAEVVSGALTGLCLSCLLSDCSGARWSLLCVENSAVNRLLCISYPDLEGSKNCLNPLCPWVASGSPSCVPSPPEKLGTNCDLSFCQVFPVLGWGRPVVLIFTEILSFGDTRVPFELFLAFSPLAACNSYMTPGTATRCPWAGESDSEGGRAGN